MPARCTLVPPYILQAVAKHADPAVRNAAIATLGLDKTFAVNRLLAAAPRRTATAATARLDRLLHDAEGEEELPGRVVRREGEPPTGDAAVDEAYDGLGATWRLYDERFGRNSIDDAGLRLSGTVHFGQSYDNAYWDGEQMVFGVPVRVVVRLPEVHGAGQSYDNAYWDGEQMVFGDGDGEVFQRFTVAVDVIGHELTHGVTGATADLEYRNQAGALNESVSDVFGSLVKQYALGQSAEQADWLIGEGLLASGVQGVALRSMKAPGTAYDDERLGGRDPQPAHLRDYVRTTSDNGGVHTNSGIPNHAFYLAAIGLGGNAWERAGAVWYDVLTGGELPRTATFPQFARLTVAAAERRFDAAAATAVRQAWSGVGLEVA